MIIQEEFIIPPDILDGLEKGLYNRFGGVIRWATGPNKGAIVCMLEPISSNNMNSQQVLEEAAANAATSTVTQPDSNTDSSVNHILAVIVIVFAILCIIGIAYLVYRFVQRSKFKKNMSIYIDAISKGALTVEIIDNLMNSVKRVKTIQIDSKDFIKILVIIRDYTINIAEKNNIEIENISKDNIVSLPEYLSIQRELLQTA
ncbi:MAG: hypothetical protein K6E47_15595 [Lachnospiraceae bacterium]|nr:hypothetical protein [Lachnospiraceae bacterium]